MSRRIQILNVTPTSSSQGSFTIGITTDNATGNWTSVFKGKFYRDLAGGELPFYTSPTVPAGYSLIQATQFDIVENTRYAGRYTVYTQPTSVGQASSVFSGGQTTIRVAQNVVVPLVPTDLTDGFITNVSTYYILRAGDTPVVVAPTVSITTEAPVELLGKDFAGWGEVFTQNLINTAQCFAGSTAPANPLVGQLWYRTSTGILSHWNGTRWFALNRFKHTQAVASTSWTINHNLNLETPFVAECTFFVDTGAGGYKQEGPFDITFTSANSLTVTFAASVTGIAFVRQ